MGRRKIRIEKIENRYTRQITYSKRRKGLEKKAYELSTLCNIDLLMIMFSESGKLTTQCLPETTTIEKVLRRVLQAPLQQWEKTSFVRIEDFELLKSIVNQLGAEREREGPMLRMPAAGDGILTAQAALAAKQQEIEHLKSCIKQLESLDCLIDARVAQADSIEALSHLGHSLQNALFQVQAFRHLKGKTPQHIEPNLPALGTNGAESLAPMPTQGNQIPTTWTDCYQPDLNHINPLQAQSNVQHGMQYGGARVAGFRQPSGAEVGESSTSTSNLPQSDMFVPNFQCDNAKFYTYGQLF